MPSSTRPAEADRSSSAADLRVYPGPQFWEDVRREFARTGLSSVARFDRDELPWVLARFAMAWSQLEELDESVPQARFAWFEALDGYRFAVTGYRWANDLVELIDFEVITWNHPDVA